MPTLTPLTDAIEYSLTVMKDELKARIAEGKFSESYERISNPLIEAVLKPMAHEMDLLGTKTLPTNLACELEAAFATAMVTAMGTWAAPSDIETHKAMVIAFAENVVNRAITALDQNQLMRINHPVEDQMEAPPSRN